MPLAVIAEPKAKQSRGHNPAVAESAPAETRDGQPNVEANKGPKKANV
jgi:hypothetical protein